MKIREYLIDILKYIPAVIAPGLLGFLAVPILTRLFNTEEYGYYTLVMTTISLLSISVQWISESIVRFYPIYEKDNVLDKLYGGILQLLFITVFIMILICSAILFMIRNSIFVQLWNMLFIGIAVFILYAVFHVLLQFLRAKRQLSWYSTLNIWYSGASLVIGIVLVAIFHVSIEGFIWAALLSLAIALPFLWKMTVNGYFNFSNHKLSTGFTRSIASYGIPLALSDLAAIILNLSDRYVLGIFKGPDEVGIYSACYTISAQIILFIGSSFMYAWTPMASSMWETSTIDESKEFLYKVTRYYLLICVPAVVGLCVLAKPVIMLFTSGGYYEGYKIVPFVAFGMLALGLSQRFMSGSIFLKKTSQIMYPILGAALINLLLNFIFIPQYGYMAAAIITFISYIILLLVLIIVSNRYFPWKFPIKSLIKTSIASVIMGAVVYAIINNLNLELWAQLLVGLVAGIVVYALSILLLREIQKTELIALSNLWSKLVKTRDKKR